MTHKPMFENISTVDLNAIELEARRLRAQALQDWMKSVKALFSNIGSGAGTGAAKA